MRILAIETSCDETAVAVVQEVDSHYMVEHAVLASQAMLHATWGGVVPEVAAREHAAYLFPLLQKVVTDWSSIDAIAVTAGPGLVPALRVGVEAAKTFAFMLDKPLVPVHHLEGHIFSAFYIDIPPQLPALCLLVSGGHTQWVLMKQKGEYEILGSTRDDAAGEAFDKVAKMLGLPYPGGPSLSKMAQQGDPEAIAFPRPMLHSGDLDVSFSGLKTAVRVYLEQQKKMNQLVNISDVCASFEQAVVDTLVEKTVVALKRVQVKSFILAGGVSANRVLRHQLVARISREFSQVAVHIPDLTLTGDNAVMIAIAGIERYKLGHTVQPSQLISHAVVPLSNAYDIFTSST